MIVDKYDLLPECYDDRVGSINSNFIYLFFLESRNPCASIGRDGTWRMSLGKCPWVFRTHSKLFAPYHMLIYYQTYLEINHTMASFDPVLVLSKFSHQTAPVLVAFCLPGTNSLTKATPGSCSWVQSLWRASPGSHSICRQEAERDRGWSPACSPSFIWSDSLLGLPTLPNLIQKIPGRHTQRPVSVAIQDSANSRCNALQHLICKRLTSPTHYGSNHAHIWDSSPLTPLRM